MSSKADPYLENSECFIYADSDEEEEAAAEGEEPKGAEPKKLGSESLDAENLEETGLSAMDMAAGNLRVSDRFMKRK